MNEQKLKRIYMCLYAMCAIKGLAALYVILTTAMVAGSYSLAADFAGSVTLYGALVFAVGLAIGTYFIVENLKAGKGWAWVAAMSLALIGFPSLAFPAALLALLTLVDSDIRTHYLKELDFKI